MNTHPDFQDFLKLLNDHRVEYMVVGGYAVAFHGYPRFTKDIDIFYRSSAENAERLRAALLSFGFRPETISIEMLVADNRITSLGREPLRIDLLNAIDGVGFEECLSGVVVGTYGDVPIPFIGMDALLANKRASNRPQDRVDVERLR
jgi:hypothetical protein